MPSTPQDFKKKKSKSQDPDERYAATTWGNAGVIEDLECPSGQFALVRRPGVQGLIEAGVLRDIDTLSSIVDEKHMKRVKGESEINVESLMQDEASLINILHVVDKVITYVVLKPEVHMAPNDITLREPGRVYADMIDIEDKMFIFNFAVGGTRSLESFREQRAELMGSVDSVEGLEDSTE